MRDTVIVFARAPRLGKVKRRLAHDIGERAALRFHLTTLTALLRDLKACRRFDVVLAVTPDHARVRLPVSTHRIPQGHGDLGRRMSAALRRYRRVALMGCDIPLAGAADVHAAFQRLGTADAVFGPAADGGYWLIALGPRRPGDLFGQSRWSTEHALADTLEQFRHHRVGFLRRLSDIDTAADYLALQPGPRDTPDAAQATAAGGNQPWPSPPSASTATRSTAR
jgi:rSAM/selenodomain-associated transferase 1